LQFTAIIVRAKRDKNPDRYCGEKAVVPYNEERYLSVSSVVLVGVYGFEPQTLCL